MSRRRPVLLGGRTEPPPRSPFLSATLVWLPVAVMLLVIARESTAAFGSVNTSPVLRSIFESAFGRVSDVAWETIHHYVRKTGHFLGYGTLGVTWLRAFLLVWLAPLQHQAAAVWRRWSLQMALCCTALTASLDELHQSYIPDRTGMVSDVLLDTTGALVVCLVIASFWLRRSVREAHFQSAAAS